MEGMTGFKDEIYHTSLRCNARNRPDKVALVYGDKQFTYRDLNHRVNRLGNGLMSLGLEKGEKVIILLYNCNEAIEITYASSKIGTTYIPLNYKLVAKEIQYIVNHSDAKAFILGEEFIDTVESIRGDIPKVEHFIVVGDKVPEGMISYDGLMEQSTDEEPKVSVLQSDYPYILYTSGTTGDPKGCCRTHRAVISQLLHMAIDYGFGFNDRYLNVGPLYHGAPMLQTRTNLNVGGTVHIMRSFEPELTLKIIEREKITNTFWVPTMSYEILNVPGREGYDLSSLRVLISAGAPLPLETKRGLLGFLKGVEFYEYYGAIEIGTATLLTPEDQLRKPGSVGRPVIGFDVLLLDDMGNEVPVGEVGEIYCTGYAQMNEYYKMPDQMRSAFRGDFLTVGDLGRFDEDGFLYIVDRKKDMIVSGGVNIFPVEIEDVLHCNQKIKDVAVIGVPDDKWGEAVKAIVVPKEGEEITEAEVIGFCEDKIARYKKPKSVDFIEEMPRNPSGKILKRILRDPFWEGRERKV